MNNLREQAAERAHGVQTAVTVLSGRDMQTLARAHARGDRPARSGSLPRALPTPPAEASTVQRVKLRSTMTHRVEPHPITDQRFDSVGDPVRPGVHC